MSAEDLGTKGEFRLLSKIGEGGMADVFLAERLGDDGFRTRVALKRLHQGLAMDSYFIRQLVREARLLGQLEHANIVRVFDLRRIGDEYFVVMEYVDGIDLAGAIKVHRQRQTKVPLPFFFHVALGLLEALSYAHAAVDGDGNPTPLIHRDIKPSNVMLSRRGVIKLTDFGIAHVGDGSVTGGLVQGTANYMSPEQAYGEEHLSPASDIYSLGVVFFEMLCGRPLVTGDNYLKAIQQVREQQVTSEDLKRLGVKPGLRMVIARMLAHDKESRYIDPDMVRNDLQFVADRLGVNLSWHRIRAYVGRLMGILGRAPSRATLSNLEVQDETNSGGFSGGAYGAETSLPQQAQAQDTPDTPPIAVSQTSSADVTSAVRKDLLDQQLSGLGRTDEETQSVAPAYDDDDEDKTIVKADLAPVSGSESQATLGQEDAPAKPPASPAVGPLPGAAADWIEEDETAVYSGDLLGVAPPAPATDDSFVEHTDERTIPFAGEDPPVSPVGSSSQGAAPSRLPSADDRLGAPSRQSGSFPPPPLSMTGEFRPNRPPAKPSPAVAFLPEATAAGPTGTQVLDVEKQPEDKTWVLGSPHDIGAPAAPGPVTSQRAGGASAGAAAAAPSPPVRKRKKRRKKKRRSKFFGLDNRTVLLAAIFAVVIGTLLFVILVVLLMRSHQTAQEDRAAANDLLAGIEKPSETASELEFVTRSGMVPRGPTLPPGYLLPLAGCPQPFLKESTT